MHDKGLECRLSAWFQEQAEKCGGFVSLIESVTSPGFPDVVYVFNRQIYLVELKTCASAKTRNHVLSIKFQTDQPVWHDRFCSLMGAFHPSYLLIQVGKGRLARRYLVGYPDFRDLDKVTESELDMISISLTTLFGSAAC